MRSTGLYVSSKMQDNVFYTTHFPGSTVAVFKENGQMQWRAVICMMKRETLSSYDCLNIPVPHKLVLEIDVFHPVLYSSAFSGLDGNRFLVIMY